MNIPLKDNIVKEFRLGGTRVKICNDYCINKTQGDINNILNCIAETAKGNIKKSFF